MPNMSQKNPKSIMIDYNYLPKLTPKEWKIRYNNWKSLKKPNKIHSTQTKQIFKPYINDFIMRFTYDFIAKKIPYPLNCFILSLILVPIYLLPFIYVLGPNYLYTSDPKVGALESTTFFMIVVLLPLVLIIMHKIYDHYKETFKKLRENAQVETPIYQEFISLNNWTFQSPTVHYFWIGAWIIVSGLGLWLYLNPRPTDLVDNIGIIGLLTSLAIYLIISTVVVSLSWDLYTIIRIIRRYTIMPLDIHPLHPDGAAGLKPLAQLSLSLALTPLIGVSGLIYGLTLGQRSIFEITSVFVIILLIGSMIILFIYPLINAHKVMDIKKTELMTLISIEHNQTYQTILNKTSNKYPTITNETLIQLQGITELQNQLDKMPVWPFDFQILSGFTGLIIVPIFTFIITEFLPI